MNFSHSVCWDQQLIYLRFGGDISLRDLLGIREELGQLEKIAGFSFLIDLSEGNLRSEFRELKLISRLLRGREFLSSRYFALLVTKNIDTALCLMIIQKANLSPFVEVYSTFSGACAHLDLQGEAAEQLRELSLRIPTLAPNQHELTVLNAD